MNTSSSTSFATHSLPVVRLLNNENRSPSLFLVVEYHIHVLINLVVGTYVAINRLPSISRYSEVGTGYLKYLIYSKELFCMLDETHESSLFVILTQTRILCRRPLLSESLVRLIGHRYIMCPMFKLDHSQDKKS